MTYKYLNIRHDTIKLLEENIGKTFTDITLFSWVSIPRLMKLKKKDLLILRSYCTAKEIINKRKRQPKDLD